MHDIRFEELQGKVEGNGDLSKYAALVKWLAFKKMWWVFWLFQSPPRHSNEKSKRRCQQQTLLLAMFYVYTTTLKSKLKLFIRSSCSLYNTLMSFQNDFSPILQIARVVQHLPHICGFHIVHLKLRLSTCKKVRPSQLSSLAWQPRDQKESWNLTYQSSRIMRKSLLESWSYLRKPQVRSPRQSVFFGMHSWGCLPCSKCHFGKRSWATTRPRMTQWVIWLPFVPQRLAAVNRKRKCL